jgi:hypothetical protein
MDWVFPWECESDFLYKSIRILYLEATIIITDVPQKSSPLGLRPPRSWHRGQVASILMEVMMESMSIAWNWLRIRCMKTGQKRLSFYVVPRHIYIYIYIYIAQCSKNKKEHWKCFFGHYLLLITLFSCMVVFHSTFSSWLEPSLSYLVGKNLEMGNTDVNMSNE